jgi:hypothetical protein
VATFARSTITALVLLWSFAVFAAEPAAWPTVTLAPANKVTISGALGESFQRGVARLAKPPYTEPWLRADVSFEVNRIFTNYSGDVSGRFLELAALTSPPDRLAPPTLPAIRATIVKFQKPDGHFGVDVDLSRPLAKNSPPIPMLWGNARLLVGLVTAAGQFHDETLLAAARRLGDFYVNTAPQLCSPARQADYRSSGTYGDSYTCCYFPAIEGLAMLYRATGDNRYLKQAQRMAEFFIRFDCLPVEHSHGNLCAWRGILELYAITGNRVYLDRAQAKWNAAMNGGFVWPLGGIGEHWYVSFSCDEGCSEADWLRFCLDLWRFTGQTRCLDAAERLLENHYAMNQCANGGYGMAHLDGDAAGPIGITDQSDEGPWCCSFHGPLGLYFLKGYLVAGSDRGLFVNFPYNFDGPVKAAGQEWLVSVCGEPHYVEGHTRMEIRLTPQGKAGAARSRLWVRMPGWASGATIADAAGNPLPPVVDGGYLRVDRDFAAGDTLIVDFENALVLEGRRFQKLEVAAGKVSQAKDVAVLAGPDLMFAAPVKGSGRPVLLATVDARGRMGFPGSNGGSPATVVLPGINATEAEIDAALRTAPPVFLRTWPAVAAAQQSAAGRLKPRRLPFMYDLVVVPAGSLGPALAQLAARAKLAEVEQPAPIFGDNLEKRPEIWPHKAPWKFTPQGLLVSGGDVGLLGAEGYRDYRFEFELTIPQEGQGITGWIVRAKDENNCLMFQLQTADSTASAPEFKTRPNTLRPHDCISGQWMLAEPVALPKQVRRGEPYRIAVECRQKTVDVLLDGQRIYHRADVDYRGGTVGFRAAGPNEQGLFRAISLKKL